MPENESKPVEEDVLARLGDHVVTVSDFDRHVLALPAADRPQPGETVDAWYDDQIRRLAVESVLAAEAAESDLAEEEAFVSARRDTEKLLAVQLCTRELAPEVTAISEEDLRAAYEERAEELSKPERRLVYHLFKRVDAGAQRAAVRQEVEALRERVLRGESFSKLATEHSDSESRHQKGAIGWLTPGQLAGGFDAAIFALEEGVPSEPLETRDGVHLFYVDHVAPGRRVEFDEVAPALRQSLFTQRSEEVLRRLDGEIEPPEGSLILDREAFVGVVEKGDPDAVVLRLGDVERTLADLRRAVAQVAARTPQGAPPPRPWQVLETMRRRELLERHCRAEGLVPEERVRERLESWQNATLLAAWRQRRMAEVAAADPERLRRFYESNLDRFTSSPRWHLKLLGVPLGEDPSTLMARLEKAAVEPGLDLEMLRGRVGGEIEDLGFLAVAELQRQRPRLPPLVAPLDIGEISAPTRIADRLEVVEVVAKEAASPEPFEAVEKRVAAAYAETYAREVYAELSEQILTSAELEIYPQGLERVRETGLPKSDVSAEELEELLDQL